MSVRALHSAATGMSANLFSLDVIANNLANSGTTAFKRSRANFEDLFYEQIKLPGNQNTQQGTLTPTGIAVGLGARVSSTQVDYSGGNFLETGAPLDLAIAGDGFFQINDGSQIVYSRSGVFSLDDTGTIVLTSADQSRPLQPTITIPQDATDITISGEGIVAYLLPGATEVTQAGQIQLARFINPEGLIQLGQNLYQESNASGTPLIGNPGTESRGLVRQGFLEGSNVEPVRELVDLIKTQRNFELNSQAIQAADQALQLLANLRRF